METQFLFCCEGAKAQRFKNKFLRVFASLQLILLFSVCLFTSVSFSQNLEKAGKKDMLKMNGGMSFNSILYNANGISNRRAPFTWYYSGNINFSIMDWSIPFTYSYSNQHGTFTQPFNQYGLTPQYKKLKLYLGYNSMNFSSYTLAGYTFLGAGAELTPKNWKIAVMYGRLKKAVQYDLNTSSDADMAYRRMGYGGKIAYEKNGRGINFSLFKAYDDISSLELVPVASSLKPQSNVCASFAGKMRITKKWSLSGEYGLSAFTRDVYTAQEISGKGKNYFGGSFSKKASSQFFDAYKGSVSYQRTKWNLALNYEHVAPDYQTLGAYYFTNDIENVTVSGAVRLLKEKLNLSLNTGLQRNNLDHNKISTNKRWVGSLNASYAFSQKINFNVSYSNFTGYTKMRLVIDPSTGSGQSPYYNNSFDTLNFYQISQSANAGMNYMIGGKDIKKSLMLTASFQTSGEHKGTSTSFNPFLMTNGIPSVVYNGNLAYSMLFTKTKLSLASGVNFNQSKFSNVNTVFVGPNISASKTFLNNLLRSNYSFSYNEVLTNNKAVSAVLNNRLSFNYSPKMKMTKYGKPTIGVNLNYMHRFNPSVGAFTGMVNLNYTF